MNSYDSLNLAISVGTTEDAADERLISRSRSGKPKVRLTYSGRFRIFNLSYLYLTKTQKDTLLAFYDANRGVEFTYTWPGDSTQYTVIFGDKIALKPTGPLWTCDVILLQSQ